MRGAAHGADMDMACMRRFAICRLPPADLYGKCLSAKKEQSKNIMVMFYVGSFLLSSRRVSCLNPIGARVRPLDFSYDDNLHALALLRRWGEGRANDQGIGLGETGKHGAVLFGEGARAEIALGVARKGGA